MSVVRAGAGFVVVLAGIARAVGDLLRCLSLKPQSSSRLTKSSASQSSVSWTTELLVRKDPLQAATVRPATISTTKVATKMMIQFRSLKCSSFHRWR